MSKFSERIAAARKARGMTQADLAAATDRSEETIQKLEAGQIVNTRQPELVAAALEIPLEEYLALASAAKRDVRIGRAQAGMREERQPYVNSGLAARHTRFMPGERQHISVVGRAAGSDRSHLIMGDPVETVPCPPELEAVDGAYAVNIVGDSMVPMFRSGDRAYVHPHRDLSRERGVVLQIRDDNGDLNGYVKEYVGRTDAEIIVKQYNPPAELRFPWTKVVAAHRVVELVYG